MSLEKTKSDGILSPEEIRATLRRIVTSDVFRGSPQLVCFLSFVVEAVLAGEEDSIKGYTIGTEVLRRSSSFDPQTDPIVRVEASRLRRAIDRYYAGPGLDEQIVIELPRGSYVPVIRRRTVRLQLEEASRFSQLSAVLPNRNIVGVFPLVLLSALLLAVLLTQFLLKRGSAIDSSPVLSDAGQVASSLPGSGDGMPIVLMQKFDITGLPDPRAISATALSEKLRDAFSRFDTINVAVVEPKISSRAAPAGLKLDSGMDRTADYSFTGSVNYKEGGAADVRLRLQDSSNGAVVWSKSFDGLPLSLDRSAQEDAIILDVAPVLMQPFGVIRSLDYSKLLSSNKGDPRYRCVIEASESLRSYVAQQHQDARLCLEKLTASDPTFQIGFSYLAAVYFRTYQQQYQLGEVREDTVLLLDRALGLARQGVEMKPASARAQQIMATVLFARRNVEAAFAASAQAMALNPYDMTIVADYGGRLLLAGELDKGMGMLIRAARHGAVLGSWYNTYLSLGYYLKNEMSDALYYADQDTRDGSPLSFVSKALTAFAAGDIFRSRTGVDRLAAYSLGWRDNPRHELSKYFLKGEVVDRLTGDLAAAGLKGRSAAPDGPAGAP